MFSEVIRQMGSQIFQPMTIVAAVAAGAAMMIGGCASTPSAVTADKTAHKPTVAAPSWVAGPSAPLPEGFPPPGPVGEVIIKQYPACWIAVTKRTADRSGSGELFMPLFRHIESNHIAMSSPVVMTYDRNAAGKEAMASMAFVYGKPTIGKDGQDGRVTVENEPPMLVASIGVRGQYTVGRFERAEKKVVQWLAAHSGEYQADGEARYLAYNSPFVLPWFKYGEVQIPVRRVNGQAEGNAH